MHINVRIREIAGHHQLRNGHFVVAGKIRGGVQLCVSNAINEAADGTGKFRSKLLDDCADDRRLPGVDIDIQQATRRPAAGIDPPACGKAPAARVGGRQAVDLQAGAIDRHAGADVACLNAGDCGASEIGGQRHLSGPRQRGSGKHGAPEIQRGVDIELGRRERRIKPGRLPRCREAVGQPPGGRFAVEFDLELIDRNLVVRERHVAPQGQWPQLARHCFTAPFEPAGQCPRIRSVDLGRP